MSEDEYSTNCNGNKNELVRVKVSAYNCKHYHEDVRDKMCCDAFPEGIPFETDFVLLLPQLLANTLIKYCIMPRNIWVAINCLFSRY